MRGVAHAPAIRPTAGSAASTCRSCLFAGTAPFASVGSGGASLRRRRTVAANASEFRCGRAHGDDSTDVFELPAQVRYRAAVLGGHRQEAVDRERLSLRGRPERVEPSLRRADRARELVGRRRERFEVRDAGTEAGDLLISGHMRSASPACRRMLRSVPGDSVLDGWPATVTVPDFVGWASWR